MAIEILTDRDTNQSVTEHESKCGPDTFELPYIESGKVIAWETEDIEYARQCVDEKWRSNH